MQGTSIDDKNEYYAIARTAFGRIFLWNKKAGQSVTIVLLTSQIITSPENKNVRLGNDTIALQSFFIGKDPKILDIDDIKEKKLISERIKKIRSTQPRRNVWF